MNNDGLKDAALANVLGEFVEVGAEGLGTWVVCILVQQRRCHMHWAAFADTDMCAVGVIGTELNGASFARSSRSVARRSSLESGSASSRSSWASFDLFHGTRMAASCSRGRSSDRALPVQDDRPAESRESAGDSVRYQKRRSRLTLRFNFLHTVRDAGGDSM
jgi:hypothetical protein